MSDGDVVDDEKGENGIERKIFVREEGERTPPNSEYSFMNKKRITASVFFCFCL